MDRLVARLAIITVGFVTLGVIDIEEAEAKTPAAEQLERLKPSKFLLKPPEGLPGGFTVARTEPDVDFAVFPGQFSDARLWSSWGDVLAASDGRFYAAIGDHDAPHGTTFVYCIDPKDKTVTRVIDCNQVAPAAPDKYSPGTLPFGWFCSLTWEWSSGAWQGPSILAATKCRRRWTRGLAGQIQVTTNTSLGRCPFLRQGTPRMPVRSAV